MSKKQDQAPKTEIKPAEPPKSPAKLIKGTKKQQLTRPCIPMYQY